MTVTYPSALISPTYRSISEKGEHKGKDIPERLLAKFWKERAARQTDLRTEAGRRVRVVYPGRSGVTAGPDFRDALLEVEGVGLVRGDVELHIKESDWNSHGNGGDPNYNGEVVHGALEVFSEETRLQSGVFVPVVDLQSLLTESARPKSAFPESPLSESAFSESMNDGPALDLWQILSRKGFFKPESLGEAGRTLDRAGDDRFRAKADWLAKCIQSDGPDQALYQALMEGLGYSSNRVPFTQLASLAPYELLAGAALKLPPEWRVVAIGRWLMSCSGLGEAGLPRPSGRRSPKGLGRVMDPREWHLFRVRPSNHPGRRILGAAVILDRFVERGLSAGLRQEV